MLNVGIFNDEKIEGADDEIPLLNFSLIRAKLKSLYTNIKYAQVFLVEKKFGLEVNRLAKIEGLCLRVKDLAYKDFYNISESEYFFNIDLADKGILY